MLLNLTKFRRLTPTKRHFVIYHTCYWAYMFLFFFTVPLSLGDEEHQKKFQDYVFDELGSYAMIGGGSPIESNGPLYYLIGVFMTISVSYVIITFCTVSIFNYLGSNVKHMSDKTVELMKIILYMLICLVFSPLLMGLVPLMLCFLFYFIGLSEDIIARYAGVAEAITPACKATLSLAFLKYYHMKQKRAPRTSISVRHPNAIATY
ncbi:hypothetical protein WR25_16285 [Diploscapter pachys]|uniref:Uncharacterized protein n=1 Tax=Diploscapter pachys TaxID=2018661 RepID=A0A2A2KIE4_9BILA|nr:hypothetical protein WR25_16285 [Diploscapter pachys]